MSSQQHPTLSSSADTLAKNNARIVAFLDRLPGWLDEMVDAARYGDIAVVQRLSNVLEQECRAEGYAEIARLARAVSSQTHRSQDPLAMKRGVIRLLAACGRVRKQSSRPSARARQVVAAIAAR